MQRIYMQIHLMTGYTKATNDTYSTYKVGRLILKDKNVWWKNKKVTFFAFARDFLTNNNNYNRKKVKKWHSLAFLASIFWKHWKHEGFGKICGPSEKSWNDVPAYKHTRSNTSYMWSLATVASIICISIH